MLTGKTGKLALDLLLITAPGDSERTNTGGHVRLMPVHWGLTCAGWGLIGYKNLDFWTVWELFTFPFDLVVFFDRN